MSSQNHTTATPEPVQNLGNINIKSSDEILVTEPVALQRPQTQALQTNTRANSSLAFVSESTRRNDAKRNPNKHNVGLESSK